MVSRLFWSMHRQWPTPFTDLVHICPKQEFVLVVHLQYFGYELGAQSKYDSKENKASVNGDHPNPDLIKILNKFIDEYVLCPVCKLPETSLMLKHKKDLYHHCDACGAETLIEANSKMSSIRLIL